MGSVADGCKGCGGTEHHRSNCPVIERRRLYEVREELEALAGRVLAGDLMQALLGWLGEPHAEVRR